MKKYISIPNRKKSRGVAVIFTLGILGLLTVMALGFASTALLNRKIADNTSSADYARHIAKNIAFARAAWVVKNNLIADSAYSSGSIGGSEEDFLHKMDTVLDGVELYRVTNDSGAIQSNTARWQYVYGPEQNPVSHKNPIIGRYAFAIVPDSGHLDPVGNRGQTTVSGRYGFSEKEIGVYSLFNGDTGLNKNADSAAWIKFRTFKEFAAAFKDLDADKKKNLLKDGYRIQLGPSPEAFWIDTDNNGKKTEDELYLRFNMPTSSEDWADEDKISVTKLIGEGADTSDANIKYPTDPASTKTSISFIPWLKNWTYSIPGTDWTADIMKKQIAANIIQYNRPGPTEIDPSTSKPYPTVSDQSGDWLTNPPTYAGIGRHPMLNEIGFLVRLKAEVIPEFVSKDDEAGTITYKYQPVYYMTLDTGAELIYPFGPAADMKESKISFPGITLRFTPTKFLKAGKTPDPQTTVDNLGNNLIGADGILNAQMVHTDVDRIQVQIPGSGEGTANVENLETSSSTEIKKMDSTDGPGLGWSNFSMLQESGDWNTSPGYTKANKFWKADKTGLQQTLRIKIRSLTITTKTSVGTAEEIANAMARRMTIKWRNSSWNDAASFTTPETVVLKYDGEQRDVARLDSKAFPATMTDFAPEKVWFIVYEAKDPLVNHYKTDWTVKPDNPEAQGSKTLDESKLTAAEYYPGTLADSDGNETSTSHLNSPVKDSSGNPVALLKDKEMNADGTSLEDTTLESATDPACSSTSRLSSSYIRHAPMRSFWELGFISRAEAFKTLNLGRVRVFEPETGYNARGGGSFAQGDANILDQIKFSDTTYRKDVQGKIDLNARYHKVFEWVFNKDTAASEGTTVNWYTNLITTGPAVDPYVADTVAGTTKNVVCSNSSSCLLEQHSDSCTATCLAHLLMERSMILPFRNRSDVLLDPDSTESDFTKIPGYGDLSSTAQTKLKSIQRKLRRALLYPGVSGTPDANAGSKLVREQYATRFMNLFKADDNDEHVYIIVLAQSIKDIGGAPAFVDWNGDGEYTPAGETPPTCEAKAKFLKTGYVRKLGDTYQIITPSSGTAPSLDETKTTTTVGSYDYGVDKITGETKLIVEMAKDANTGKWKIAGYRYVE